MRMPTLNQQDGRERNASRRTVRGRHPREASRGEAISGTMAQPSVIGSCRSPRPPETPAGVTRKETPPLNSTLLSNHLLGLTNVRAPPRHTCYGPVRGGQRRREDESLSTRAPERPGQGARNADAGIWLGTSRNALYPTAFSDPAIRMVTRYSQASSGVCSQQLSRAESQRQPRVTSTRFSDGCTRRFRRRAPLTWLRPCPSWTATRGPLPVAATPRLALQRVSAGSRPQLNVLSNRPAAAGTG